MKKILYFALIACLTGIVSACSDDGMDNPYRKDDALKVIRNDVQIPSVGGSGTIVVDANGAVTAESSIDWCSVSVSGNTVTFTAPANNSIESRNAFVTIKSGDKSTQVSVYQEGMVFVVGDHTFTLDDAGSAISTEVQLSNGDLAITTNSPTPWITGQYNALTKKVELNVEPNNTGIPRSGQFEVFCNGYKEVINVSQFDFTQDVLGEYYFMYYKTSSGGFAYTTATLTSKAIVLHVAEGLDFTIPVKFLNGQNEPWAITVDFGQFTGLYTDEDGTYATYVAFDRVNYNFLGRYPAYYFRYMGATKATLTIEANVDEDGYVWYGGDFGGNMDLDGSDYDAITNWNILAMTAMEFSQQAYAGLLMQMFYPGVQKIEFEPEDEGAARRRAPRASRGVPFK